MDKFIEYQTFPEIEIASEIIEILKRNDIPYQIDDSASRFQVVGFGDTSINKIALQIRESDIDKVNLLISEKQTEEDHYLYTFSDTDIIDVIANPNEWTSQEYSIAQQIFKQRNLIVSADDIKSARKQKMTEKITQTLTIDKFYKSISGWYNAIGIFSIINTIGLALKWRVSFLLGLGVTQVIDSVFINLLGQYFMITGIISIIFSSIFFIFGFLSKKKNHPAIIVGMVLYGLDAVVMFILKFWIGFGFHVFILIVLISSYEKIIQERRKTLPNT